MAELPEDWGEGELPEDFIDATEYYKRRLFHDIIPCDQLEEFMESWDIMPGSLEVEKMEHRASHNRLELATPIIPYIRVLGSLAGRIAGRAVLEIQDIDYDEEVDLEVAERVAMVTSHAVIVNLIDMGLLHLGGHP